MLTPNDYYHAGQRSESAIPPEPQGEAKGQVGAAGNHAMLMFDPGRLAYCDRPVRRYRAECVGGPVDGAEYWMPRGTELFLWSAPATGIVHRYRAMRDRDGIKLIYCGVVT